MALPGSVDIPESIDPDCDTKATSFTTKSYRDVYPAIDPSRPEISQAGKIIIITGASRGIGRLGFAASFARANAASIVLIGRSASNLRETEKLVNEINPQTNVLSIAVDVTDEAGMEDAFQKVVSQLGVPHVLVNNAGMLASLEKVVDMSLESWCSTQDVTIKGTFIATKAFLKHTGTSPSKPTTIINVSSLAAFGTPPGQVSYSTAKLAIIRFTSFLNSEYPDVTSISIHPGIVATDMGLSVDYLAPIMKDTPELCGGAAVWLSSGDKSYLSGRWVSANWDVEELERRKDEIRKENLLTIALKADLGGPHVVIEKPGK